MSEPETITLPKSGIVLTIREPGDIWIGPHGLDCYMSAWPSQHIVFLGSHSFSGTREECIAWLDARVLALRAALLPPGSVVVTPGEETVERVAEAVQGGLDSVGDCSCHIAPPCSSCVSKCEVVARAVLAALGVTNAG